MMAGAPPITGVTSTPSQMIVPMAMMIDSVITSMVCSTDTTLRNMMNRQTTMATAL